MFKSLLMNGVLATVQSFDGSANILSLTLPAEKGGGNLTSMILDALQAKTKSTTLPSNMVKTDQTDSCTTSTSTTAAPDCPQPRSVPETQKVLESSTAATDPDITSEHLTSWMPQQKKNTSAESVSGWSILRISL